MLKMLLCTRIDSTYIYIYQIDGNSEKGAHVWSDLGYLVCL